MLKPDKVFNVRDDYDLEGAVVDIPEGCVLKFEGGSISNGILKGNSNDIVSPRYKIFENIKFSGHFSVPEVYPEWWGGYPNRGLDCYQAIQTAMEFASAHGGDEGKTVKFAVGRYGISRTLVLKQGCRLSGVSAKSTWIYSLDGNIKGEWMIDTPEDNNMQPVSSSIIENIQIRCTDSMCGEQFEKTCNGVRCRGWNETCGMKNVHINGFNRYGLFLTFNERTITQNCSFRDIFISNSNRNDGGSIGIYLDNVRQCVFESMTIDNGSGTENGIGYGLYANGHCDMNVFCKLYLEDCYHPIYVKDGIDECTFLSLMVSNPTHPMKTYSHTGSFRSAIYMEQCYRGFTIINYKRNKNEGVEYDIVDLKCNNKIVFNKNIKTGNSNRRHFVYEPNNNF